MSKEKKKKIIKIVVTSVIAILFVWFFIIYPLGYFNKNENEMKKAAKHYFEINYTELPEKDEVRTLTLSELSNEKYIDDLYVPYSKKVCSVKDSWVKVRKEGDDYKYYVYLKCGYLSSSVDHTGPEITLNGDSVITLDKGETYEEKGVKSVYDKVDKELKKEDVVIKNSDVNTNKLGIYKVTYKAYDSLNNETVVERTIKVVQKLSGVVNNDTEKRGYYTGTVSNNYLQLSNMLFRIVGVNNDGSVRIVSEEDIAHLDYDGIQSWLNNYYYAHLTDSAKEFLTEGEFCEEQLKTADVKTAGCSEKRNKKKVGILSVEDLAKSLDGNTSYLYKDTMAWLGNDKDEKEAWTTRNWYLGTDSKYMSFDKKYSFVVRPVLTIKKGTLIKGGEGTVENPYVIENIKPAKADTKLNTRLTGEYVTYGGYKFRIIESVADGTTKVIAEEPLQIGTEQNEISYTVGKDTVQYNPKQKGNIGYKIENETPNYIKTNMFTSHEIEVPIYKDYAIYGKTDLVKKYKVRFAAPSGAEMFSGSNHAIGKSYWLRDSSKEEGRKYLVANAGNVFYTKQFEDATGGVRIVAYMKKSATILDGEGTYSNPYTLAN